MFVKTLGSVMKIKLGPASGEMPKEKQAGKMISPAQTATKVSSTQIRAASPGRGKAAVHVTAENFNRTDAQAQGKND